MISISQCLYLRTTFLPYFRKETGCPIIRLQLKGIRGNRFYRLVVCNQRDPRDGKYIEVLGSYAPDVKANVKDIRLRFSRVKFWIGVGAKLSRPACDIISHAGLAPPRPPLLRHLCLGHYGPMTDSFPDHDRPSKPGHGVDRTVRIRSPSGSQVWERRIWEPLSDQLHDLFVQPR